MILWKREKLLTTSKATFRFKDSRYLSHVYTPRKRFRSITSQVLLLSAQTFSLLVSWCLEEGSRAVPRIIIKECSDERESRNYPRLVWENNPLCSRPDELLSSTSRFRFTGKRRIRGRHILWLSYDLFLSFKN